MAITRYPTTTDLFRPLLDDFLAPMARAGVGMRTPDTDVIETESEIRVVCELPGMSPDEVEIDLENNVLTISGEKESRKDDDGATYHMSERRWGRFSRSFVLPREVEQDSIEAYFENGVLSVRVPKTEKARRRRIEIRNGNGQRRIESGQGQEVG